MDKEGALNLVEALLEREGRADVLEVVRAAFAEASSEGRSAEPSEGTAHLLLESMTDGLLVHRGGPILYANAAGLRLLGYPPGALVGTQVADVLHPDDVDIVRPRVLELLRNPDAVLPLSEVRVVRRDGTYVPAEVAATRIIYEGEVAVLALARDISSRKKMEAQLVATDRLASLGRLAASMGHELNNPLAYVLGNVTFLEREVGRAVYLQPALREQLSSCVSMIREGSERIRDIVNDLRTISRSDELEHATIDVQHILDVCVNLAEHDLRARARIVRNYPEKVYVRGSNARLGQLFLNLLARVAQVIPAGDAERHELRIAVENGPQDEAVIELVCTVVSPEAAPIEDATASPARPGEVPEEADSFGWSIAQGLVASAGGTLAAERPSTGGVAYRIVLPTS